MAHAQENDGVRGELQTALMAARNLPANDLPRLLGDLEMIRCIGLARLAAPAAAEGHDELLTAEQAAARLGMSVSYLYRNHASLPFARKIGRNLRFSSFGIDEYIKRGGALTRKRHTAIMA